MKTKLLSLLLSTVLTQQVYAAECSVDVRAAAADLRQTYLDQKRVLLKLSARLQGQSFDVMDLTEAQQALVPPPPKAPDLPEADFDEADAPRLVCDDAGSAGDAPTEIAERLAASSEALEAFGEAIGARADAIEQAAAQAIPAEEGDGNLAEADPAKPSDDGDTDEDDTENENNGAATGEDATAAAPESNAATDADPAKTADAKQPLADPNNPYLFRRVITLPNAALHDAASPDASPRDVPLFSVLYVFDEKSVSGVTWLNVGRRFANGADAWIQAETVLPWSSMMVMQFAPRGQRGRVLFFDEAVTLTDMVNSPFYRNDAQTFYTSIEQEKERIKGEPGAVPAWDDKLVAIEPETAVTFSDQPYLLPILDFKQELFDGTTETTLVRVAAVPADADSVAARDSGSFASDASALAMNDGEFRIGVVFVLDTTASMQPFINRTKETVREFYNAFSQFETTEYVSFGVIGVRDSRDNNPSDDNYVTRIYQPLDVEAKPNRVLRSIERVAATRVPTIDFREDIYAGLNVAVEDMDWSAYDAKLVILVTDASSRTGNDPLSAEPGLSADEIQQSARDKGIVVVPIHLKTPVNQRNGDFEIGMEQYQVLAQTGDLAMDKYLAVDGTSDERFTPLLQKFASRVAQAVLQANSGQMVENRTRDVELEEVGVVDDDALADVVTNEVFRAQLESLAKVEGADSPSFLAGWASDRDLTNPDVETLEVSVFLTRNQLSTLEKKLDLVVDAARTSGDGAAFFDRLQSLAAEMSSDPNAARMDERKAVQTILPAFLAALPYRSDVLRLDREYWNSLSPDTQEAFIEEIERKQRIYADTFNRTDLWVDFGAGDPGLTATPIRLTNLP